MMFLMKNDELVESHYRHFHEITHDPTAAAILAVGCVLAKRLDALGFDTENRTEGMGIGEKIAKEIEDLQKNMRSCAEALDRIELTINPIA